MVTQEAFLFSGSVADNIALGRPDASRAEIVAAAEAVGARAFIEALPDGFDTDVRKRGGRLSAGQRQLVAFARALLADPAVLILDEATSSLDVPSERAVQAALETVLADRTALIIAHRLSTVLIADRVLVMADGRIVEDGPRRELIADGGEFAELHAAWRASLHGLTSRHGESDPTGVVIRGESSRAASFREAASRRGRFRDGESTTPVRARGRAGLPSGPCSPTPRPRRSTSCAACSATTPSAASRRRSSTTSARAATRSC